MDPYRDSRKSCQIDLKPHQGPLLFNRIQRRIRFSSGDTNRGDQNKDAEPVPAANLVRVFLEGLPTFPHFHAIHLRDVKISVFHSIGKSNGRIYLKPKMFDWTKKSANDNNHRETTLIRSKQFYVILGRKPSHPFVGG